MVMLIKIRWFILLPVLISNITFAQTVLINELLSSNVTDHPEMVDFDDYSDWLELYNPDNVPISLNGYFLTDDIIEPLKWKIPDGTIIDGEGFLVIWADDFDEVPGRFYTRPYWPWEDFTTQNYHVNFKLSRSGEYLGLFKANQAETITIIDEGALWKYLDNGSDQQFEWINIDFNDNSWDTGYAELGYGDNDEATIVSYGPDEDNKYITTYFRKIFSINDAENIYDINIRLLRDDGAIVYLNGVEAIRDNMPQGAVGHETPANDAVGFGQEETYFDWSVPGDLLMNGQNIIAVEIHQVDESSSDISFNLELSVTNYSDITLIDSVVYENQITDVSYG